MSGNAAVLDSALPGPSALSGVTFTVTLEPVAVAITQLESTTWDGRGMPPIPGIPVNILEGFQVRPESLVAKSTNAHGELSGAVNVAGRNPRVESTNVGVS